MPSSSASGCPFLDPNALDLHAEAADLRTRGPAVLVELPGGVRAWSVTRHDVIQTLTNDPRISRDFRLHWPGLEDVPKGWSLASIALQQGFINAYGTEHRQQRRRIAPAFSPRRVEAMRPQVQATADRLVDAIAAVPAGGTADIRRSLSLPLAMTVICDLFGVPEAMRKRLGAAIDGVIDTTTDDEAGLARQVELQARLVELVEYKKAHRGEDLTSDLLAPPVGDEKPLSEGELIDTFFLMLGAGYETTVNLITSAVHALLSHPEHLERVRADAIGWGDVVEEALRFEGPVMYLPLRYAVEEVDLGEGVVLAKGDPVIIGFAAAGRDPVRHPDPDVFDPTRPDKEHLAFGHGPHFCLGAHLARLEADVALTTIFTRFPNMTLARPDIPSPRLPSFVVNGAAHLYVVPTPDE